MKRKLISIALGITAFFALFAHFVGTDPGITPAQTVMASRRSFTIEVNTIGTLDAAKSNMVTSSLKSGKAKLIHLIEDGSWVNAGDVLARLDPVPFEEEILKLKGEIKKLEAAAAAKQQLFEWEKSQVEKELSTAEFTVHKAELELAKYEKGEGPLQLAQYKEEIDKIEKEKNRFASYLKDLKDLKSRGYDHPSEIAKAESEVLALTEKLTAASRKYGNYKDHVFPSMQEAYRADVEQAEMVREQTLKASVHKIAQAKSALDEVTADLENYALRLAQAESQLKDTLITAPSAGIVILYEAFRDGQNRKPRVGDLVLQNQPILYLPDVSSMIVKTSIREVDLHKVGTGQPCTVTVDAYPDKKLAGTVSFIGALAADKRGGTSGAKYFQMTVVIDASDPDLRPGMTARVNILTETVENALTLPLYALFEETGRLYCLRSKDGDLEKIFPGLGRRNEDFIEITGGIEEFDLISTVRPTTNL